MTSLDYLMTLGLQELNKLEQMEGELQRRADLEANPSEFVRVAWPSIDPAEYQESWAIDALCEHLEADETRRGAFGSPFGSGGLTSARRRADPMMERINVRGWG
jgi:hypothetical protein